MTVDCNDVENSVTRDVFIQWGGAGPGLLAELNTIVFYQARQNNFKISAFGRLPLIGKTGLLLLLIIIFIIIIIIIILLLHIK